MQNFNERVFDLLERTGQNWSVDKRELFTASGAKTESFGIFKTGTDQWLGTVGKKYIPHQNSAGAETLLRAADNLDQNDINGPILGGVLQEGKKVYLQVRLHDRRIEDDTVKRYITAVNSHDGSCSIAFGSTNTVIVCQNSFYMAYKGLSKIRHTIGADEKIKQAERSLIAAIKKDETLMENYERMTEFAIDKPIFSSVINTLFGVEDMNVSASDVSTRKRNQMNTFNQVLESELESHGNSLWGLFNAVTFFTNHKKTSKEKSLDYIMHGQGARLNFKTYDDIVKFMDQKKPIYV